jgi:hypothetical protein
MPCFARSGDFDAVRANELQQSNATTMITRFTLLAKIIALSGSLLVVELQRALGLTCELTE